MSVLTASAATLSRPPKSYVPNPAARVRHAMVTLPKTHGMGTPLEVIRALFEDDHVHMALIVANRRLITTIERSDLGEPLPGWTPAEWVGTVVERTVSPDRSLDEVTAELKQAGRRRLAVVDDSVGLLGLLCLKHDDSGYCTDEGVRQRAAERSSVTVSR
jgi:CBS-domain-containing membrane protein